MPRGGRSLGSQGNVLGPSVALRKARRGWPRTDWQNNRPQRVATAPRALFWAAEGSPVLIRVMQVHC